MIEKVREVVQWALWLCRSLVWALWLFCRITRTNGDSSRLFSLDTKSRLRDSLAVLVWSLSLSFDCLQRSGFLLARSVRSIATISLLKPLLPLSDKWLALWHFTYWTEGVSLKRCVKYFFQRKRLAALHAAAPHHHRWWSASVLF